MQRQQIPAALGGRFTVREAAAVGVTASRLRAADLRRPFHGVRTRPRGPDAETLLTAEARLLDAALDYACRMTEHQFFSHVAAAVIWDLPLPLRLLRDRALDVAVHSPRRAPAGRGVIGHVVDRSLAHTVQHPVHGIRLTTPASTWAALAGSVGDSRDLVAVADAVVREPMHRLDPGALGTPAQLEAAANAGRRVGRPRLLAALPLVSTRSRSRAETWLRLAIIEAGLPVPEENLDVFDAGRWLAQVDLAYPSARLALEYEGEHHLIDPQQWAADLARYDRLAEAGWRVIRVTKAEVFGDSAALIARIRRALALASSQ